MKISKTAKNVNDISNLRQIRFKFGGQHNNKIIVHEPNRYNRDVTKRVHLSTSSMTNDLAYHMYELMTSRGWNVVCRANEANEYIFLCNNWGPDEFLEIANLKNA